MELVKVGKIVDSFGIDGTMKILSSSSFSEQRYKVGNTLILFDEKNVTQTPVTVESYRKQLDIDVVRFKEITSKEDALAKKNMLIMAEKDEALLSKGQYYYSDLEGCAIVDEKNNVLGTVKKVEEFPAQITLRVKRNNEKDFFVPFIKEFIISVDIINKSIKIHLIEGML